MGQHSPVAGSFCTVEFIDHDIFKLAGGKVVQVIVSAKTLYHCENRTAITGIGIAPSVDHAKIRVIHDLAESFQGTAQYIFAVGYKQKAFMAALLKVKRCKICFSDPGGSDYCGLGCSLPALGRQAFKGFFLRGVGLKSCIGMSILVTGVKDLRGFFRLQTPFVSASIKMP